MSQYFMVCVYIWYVLYGVKRTSDGNVPKNYTEFFCCMCSL